MFLRNDTNFFNSSSAWPEFFSNNSFGTMSPSFQGTTAAAATKSGSVSLDTAYLVVGLIGIMGNLFVCVVVASYAPMRKKLANYFLIHATPSDRSICST